MAERHQSPKKLLAIGVRAAEKAMRGKRPSEKIFTQGKRAAQKAILAADPQAGTSTHRYRAARYSHGVWSLATRSTNLARRLLWTGSGKMPTWEKRLGRDYDPTIKKIPAQKKPYKRRKPSRTRAQYEASLRYNIKDAKEALTNAVGMSNWGAVEKYTKQIKAYERKLFDLETGKQKSPTRARRRRGFYEEVEHRAAQKRRKVRGLP